jgi:hypothetical protein
MSDRNGPDLSAVLAASSGAPAPGHAEPGRHDGSAAPPRHVLMVGAVGRLGAAVLEQLLREGGFDGVAVLAKRPVGVALAGLRVVQQAQQPQQGVGPRIEPLTLGTDTAVLVLDKSRSRHGREAAFVQADETGLPDLAAALHAAGVQRLVLVVPHAPGLLPAALRAGLATRQEHDVASLGFEQLVLVRPALASAASPASGQGWLNRLAGVLLAQLHWMVPQREQPLRPQRVAEAVARLAHQLPLARPGTRVLGPEGLWAWAQPTGGEAWLQAWLSDQPLPSLSGPRQRW